MQRNKLEPTDFIQLQVSFEHVAREMFSLGMSLDKANCFDESFDVLELRKKLGSVRKKLAEIQQG
jgi:hypothetical protein